MQHEQWTQTHRGSDLDLLASLKHHMRWYFTKRFLSEQKIKKTLKTVTKSTKSPLKWRAWRARLATREFLTPPVSVCVCVCVSVCVSGVCVHLTDVELHNSTWLLSKTNWPVEEMHIRHRVGNAERARCIKTLSADGGAQASGKKQSAGTRARAPRAEGKCYRRCGYLIRAGSFRIESHQRGE